VPARLDMCLEVARSLHMPLPRRLHMPYTKSPRLVQREQRDLMSLMCHTSYAGQRLLTSLGLGPQRLRHHPPFHLLPHSTETEEQRL
jgi:hypothetical protein